MGFFNWLKGVFPFKAGRYSLTSLTLEAQDKITDVFYRYVVSICCNKIANGLSLCKYTTYEHSKEVKNDLWYKLNIEPNKNQNASDFWNKLVYEMVTNPQGALVVQVGFNNELLIVDDYTIDEKVTKENSYKNVISGDLTFNKKFREKDVLHLKWNNTNLNDLFLSIYNEVGRMLTTSIKNYNRANAKKYILNISTQFDQLKQIKTDDGQTEFDNILDDLFTNRFKQLMTDRDAVIPLEDGLELSEQKNEQVSQTTDIRNLIDDIVNIGADAFGIPRGLLKGDIADIEAMTDNFISFCINPLVNQIEDEINRKLFFKEEILNGTKVRIKTSSLKTYDPIRFANAAEALYRIRSVNTNWVREMLNEEPISEKWAEEYMETKNYQHVGARRVSEDDI